MLCQFHTEGGGTFVHSVSYMYRLLFLPKHLTILIVKYWFQCLVIMLASTLYMKEIVSMFPNMSLLYCFYQLDNSY